MHRRCVKKHDQRIQWPSFLQAARAPYCVSLESPRSFGTSYVLTTGTSPYPGPSIGWRVPANEASRSRRWAELNEQEFSGPSIGGSVADRGSFTGETAAATVVCASQKREEKESLTNCGGGGGDDDDIAQRGDGVGGRMVD